MITHEVLKSAIVSVSEVLCADARSNERAPVVVCAATAVISSFSCPVGVAQVDD